MVKVELTGRARVDRWFRFNLDAVVWLTKMIGLYEFATFKDEDDIPLLTIEGR